MTATAAIAAVRPRTVALRMPAVAARARVLLPAAVYLAGQALALAMVALGAHAHRRGLYGYLVATWDGKDFLGIASHGYAHGVTSGTENSVAFFPGYPLTLRALHNLTQLSVGTLSVAVSLTAGVTFAYGLARLVGGGRLGLTLVAVASVSPLSIVLLMAYSEALFCALAVWALVAVQRRHWLTAGALIMLAGTVRQTAIALVLALAVAVIIARPGRIRERSAALAALALAPVGAVGYLAWADRWTGVRRSWFHIEDNGWGSRIDFGRQFARWAYRSLLYAPAVVDVVTVLLAAAAVALLARLAWDRRAVLFTYAAAVVALDLLSAGIMNSKARLLVPAFPLLIPVAQWVARQSAARTAALLAGLALAGTWYSAYMVTMFGHSL